MKKFTLIYKSSILLLMCLTLAFVCSGCATICRGSTEILVIESQPTNAHVSLSNGMSGMTPAKFKIARTSCLTGVIEKDGYKPFCFQVNHKTSGCNVATVSSLDLFGLVGVCIDGASGATRELTPNPIFAELESIVCESKYSCLEWQ